MTRPFDRRLERVAERLVHAGRLVLPAGPVWTWPEADLARLRHLIEVSEKTRRAAWSRLTDADLEWLVATWGGDAEAAVAANGTG